MGKISRGGEERLDFWRDNWESRAELMESR